MKAKLKKKIDLRFPIISGSLIISIVLVAAVLLGLHINAKYPWFWMYMGDKLQAKSAPAIVGPRHVMFVFVDHFESHDQSTMDRWLKSYPEMAARHRDADGRMPQHSWFWYFAKSKDEEKMRFLNQLSEMAYAGLGEVELRMHHWNDTSDTLTALMRKALDQSRKNGAMVTQEPAPRTTFGFIHGLWSLDNSRGAGACGVNDELIILRKLGCYADFTHPSWGAMHPRMVNRIYYATDDPNQPKSEDTGSPLEVDKPGIGDLVIFEGPSVVRWKGIRPVYDHGDVTGEYLPVPERVDDWIKAGVHVKGRPEWVFVKVFTHGALKKDHDAVLGRFRDEMHSYLEFKYNDGKDYVLHYATAREAYNIAKAAEAGKRGNPDKYRNFIIPPYVNRFMIASLPYEIIRFESNQAVIQFDAAPGSVVKMRLRAHGVKVTGAASVIKEEIFQKESVLELMITGTGQVGLGFNRTNEMSESRTVGGESAA